MNKRFTTFEGVFTPTFLSILGVIMYLRLGWVVGQVGLVPALGIIVTANLVTFFTGLSMASITTNVRVGAGGAYALIAKSLGLEVGGAIGIPLYLSQAISVAFYIAGFAECWVGVFPGHDFKTVCLVLWGLLLLVSYLSARLAFRLQYAVMAVIIASLFSVFLSDKVAPHASGFWSGTGQVPFWHVFAIFFPAVTGILAGVSMSGELKEPEKSIPRGTLSAIGITFLIYMALGVWFARAGDPAGLVASSTFVIDHSRWRGVVVAGIMGATLSSALSMFVAAPRTLFALGRHRLLPGGRHFERLNKRGEPTPAIFLTAFVALVTISLGTLNAIAGILTMFFLITYGALNASVFIEKTIGIVSFRPTFRVHPVISLAGAVGCFYAMFVINPFFSIVAIGATAGVYALLFNTQTRRYWPDVRKGLFIFFAEQALKVAQGLPYHPKIWKPNLLIPVENPRDWTGIVEFLRAVAFPGGRVQLFKICWHQAQAQEATERRKTLEELGVIARPLREEGILVSSMCAAADNFMQAASVIMESQKGSVFPPNVLFVKLGGSCEKDGMLRELLGKAALLDLGLMVFIWHAKVGLGRKETINLWIRQGSPNLDLAILVALQLEKNWDGKLRLVQAVGDARERADAESYLTKLRRVMRLPGDIEPCVLEGCFDDILAQAPAADINIFGMAEGTDMAWMKGVSRKVSTCALFLRDSKQESAAV
ncbi:MAG: amino acid permease [Deltaproteobacteria bacterium]